LSKEEYNKAVRDAINNIFTGGFFGTHMCEDELKSNPLRKTDLFAVDSLNGYNKLSDLLKSVISASDIPSPPPGYTPKAPPPK
jgi:hypothetical protein